MKKKLFIGFILLISVCFLSFNINAKETISNKHVIFSDLNNEDETLNAVQIEFDKGAEIVEVYDTQSSFNSLSLNRAAGWHENKKRYYYSDILHGSEGTLTCYVVTGTPNSDHVTNCSLNVDYWGTGLTVERKSIKKNYTRDVYGSWYTRITGGLVYVSPEQTVPLFN